MTHFITIDEFTRCGARCARADASTDWRQVTCADCLKGVWVNHSHDPNAKGPVVEQMKGESTADFANRVERETGERVIVLPSAADDA